MSTADKMMWTITIVFSMVLVMAFGAILYGLFDARVDNKEIFPLLNAWGDRIVTALAVILGAKAMAGQKT